ncbi:MAG: hypothetical protein LBL59_04315 [Xanthomonadaceae bacterium]|jgi:hypothetical protein|nr:hypothetical protein [Xanthomonadaceae bacterium]
MISVKNRSLAAAYRALVDHDIDATDALKMMSVFASRLMEAHAGFLAGFGIRINCEVFDLLLPRAADERPSGMRCSDTGI